MEKRGNIVVKSFEEMKPYFDKNQKRLKRPVMIYPDKEGVALLFPCECLSQRGNKGDVCGNCGNAIPTDEELKQINQ